MRSRGTTCVGISRRCCSSRSMSRCCSCTPADSDVLAVCGRPLPQLEEATGQAWHQMPGPRVRVDVEDAARVAESLDHARARLLDTGHHRHDADSRPVAADLISAKEQHGSMDQGVRQPAYGGEMRAECRPVRLRSSPPGRRTSALRGLSGKTHPRRLDLSRRWWPLSPPWAAWRRASEQGCSGVCSPVRELASASSPLTFDLADGLTDAALGR